MAVTTTKASQADKHPRYEHTRDDMNGAALRKDAIT
jgi:hypothetical protein